MYVQRGSKCGSVLFSPCVNLYARRMCDSHIVLNSSNFCYECKKKNKREKHIVKKRHNQEIPLSNLEFDHVSIRDERKKKKECPTRRVLSGLMTELHLSVCSLLLVLVRHREGTRPRPAATTLKSYWRYNGSCLPSGKPIAHVCPRFRDTYGINSIDPSSHVGFYWGGGESS